MEPQRLYKISFWEFIAPTKSYTLTSACVCIGSRGLDERRQNKTMILIF